MKKVFFTLAFLFASLIVGYAQSKETLGDRAMASGDYAGAVEYYNQAIAESSSASLLEKLNKASLLKGEFEAMDVAVANRNAEELELHIQNVLMIDPGNQFVEEKRQQLKNQQSSHRGNVMRQIFLGDDYRQDVFSPISFDQGMFALTAPSVYGQPKYGIFQRVSLKFYRHFPIVVDLQTAFSYKKLSKELLDNRIVVGLGGGSCLFFNDNLTLDYGGGVEWSRFDLRPDALGRGYYYRAGLTYMWDEWIGLNYTFYRNVEQDFSSNVHALSFVWAVGPETNHDKTLSGCIIVANLILGLMIIGSIIPVNKNM